MIFEENDKLELKEKFTDSLVKEVVSFLNSKGGTIILGIKDNKEVVGLFNPDEVQRKISDIVTDQISPRCVELVHVHIEELDCKQV